MKEKVKRNKKMLDYYQRGNYSLRAIGRMFGITETAVLHIVKRDKKKYGKRKNK